MPSLLKPVSLFRGDKALLRAAIDEYICAVRNYISPECEQTNKIAYDEAVKIAKRLEDLRKRFR